MNLYRLDYENPDGTTFAVRDFHGDVLTRTAATARMRATDAATVGAKPVVISRISGAGSMRRMLRAFPGGIVARYESHSPEAASKRV